MERQLYFFLALIALFTGAYFVYDFLMLTVFSTPGLDIDSIAREHANNAGLLGGCMIVLGIFFAVAAWRTKSRGD